MRASSPPRAWIIGLMALTLGGPGLAGSQGPITRAGESPTRHARSGFSALFPARPTTSHDAPVEMWLLSEHQDKEGFVLAVTTYSRPMDVTDRTMVQDSVKTLYAGFKRSLTVNRHTKFEGGTFGPERFPTAYFEFVLADGGVYQTRVVFTPTHMIQATISGPKAWAAGPRARGFMDSLRYDSPR